MKCIFESGKYAVAPCCSTLVYWPPYRHVVPLNQSFVWCRAPQVWVQDQIKVRDKIVIWFTTTAASAAATTTTTRTTTPNAVIKLPLAATSYSTATVNTTFTGKRHTSAREVHEDVARLTGLGTRKGKDCYAPVTKRSTRVCRRE